MFCPNTMPMVVMLEEPTPAGKRSPAGEGRSAKRQPKADRGIINSIWLL